MNQEVTLREYIDLRFDVSDKAIAAALAAAEKAVLKAESASEKRFESVNEFRSTLADQQRMLMPRTETELLIKNIADRLKAIEDAKIAKIGESGGMKNLWSIILGVAGLVSIILGLIAYFTNK